MNNWYKRAIYIEAQTLEDFFNGNVNDIIQNNILRNPKSKEWDEQRFNEVFLEISFKSLRKAIRKELNIIISEIPKDIEGMNELVIYLINNKDNILNNEKIQTKKTFKDVYELSSYIDDNKEIYLSPEDENILRIELQNGNSYLDEWIKFVIYDSRENPQDVDLSYIRDWLHYYTNQYNSIPKVNQQKAIELSRSWHEELLKHEVTNYSDEELREKPNKGQKGDKVQRIQLDSIMKDSMNKLPNNIQESISQLEKDGIYVIELNSAKDLVLEGKRMQHCVGSYPDRVRGGNVEIYSLRDANGKSFATIELQKNPEGNLNSVTQIKGSNNQVPIDKYRPFIMQWVLNNDLKIYGDIQGALLSPIFEEVLGPYESIDTFDNIRDIDLGLLTPYKKSFIDSKFNIDILLNNTDNEEFLLELIDNDRYTYFISNRLHIPEVVQHKLLEKGDYDVVKKLLSNPNLAPEIQYKILEKGRNYYLINLASNPNLVPEIQYKLIEKGGDNILRILASNPNLVSEIQSIKGLFDPKIPISKEIQYKLLENGDIDVLGNLASNPSLVPELQSIKGLFDYSIPISKEIQYKLLENGDIDVLKNLASNSSLVPEIQSRLLEKGNYDVLGNLSSNPSLVPEIQSRLLENRDIDVLGNLSSNPNLAPEIQYKLLEKGKNYYLINLASNPNLVSEIQSIKGLFDPKIPISKEIQYKLLEKGNYDVLRILASNPSLVPELQSIKGLFDTNIPISKEIQYKLMENGDNYVLKTLASNPNLVSEVQNKLLENGDIDVLKNLASNSSLVPEIQSRLLEKGNYDVLGNLSSNPNLAPEIQYKLLEKGNKLLEKGNINCAYILYYLFKNPSLAPEVREKLIKHKVSNKKNSWYKRANEFLGADGPLSNGSHISDIPKRNIDGDRFLYPSISFNSNKNIEDNVSKIKHDKCERCGLELEEFEKLGYFFTNEDGSKEEAYKCNNCKYNNHYNRTISRKKNKKIRRRRKAGKLITASPFSTFDGWQTGYNPANTPMGRLDLSEDQRMITWNKIDDGFSNEWNRQKQKRNDDEIKIIKIKGKDGKIKHIKLKKKLIDSNAIQPSNSYTQKGRVRKQRRYNPGDGKGKQNPGAWPHNRNWVGPGSGWYQAPMSNNIDTDMRQRVSSWWEHLNNRNMYTLTHPY